jgi:Domain of unknown function (DUF4276)
LNQENSSLSIRLGLRKRLLRRGFTSLAKRLVIFVEGKGDIQAVPALVQRVVNEMGAHDALFVDHVPFEARSVAKLVKDNCRNWHRWLEAAGKTRNNLGAVLLVLDGDADRVPSTWDAYSNRFGSDAFCAYHTAAMLGHEARAVRAGDRYSLATVFAMKEFEAWLLAGVESLRGKSLAERRGNVPLEAMCPNIDLENIRDAKGRLKQVIPGYDQSLDQGVLAREIDLQAVQNRSRSFRRFCSAMRELADAVRGDAHVLTPPLPAE